MARIIVMAEDDPSKVLMDEEVRPIHITEERSANQLMERLVWAVYDDGDERLPPSLGQEAIAS